MDFAISGGRWGGVGLIDRHQTLVVSSPINALCAA